MSIKVGDFSLTDVVDIFSVGHSTMPYESFLSLVRSAGITAIADVRSSPFSKQFPQFSQRTLKEELRLDGISYVFLGHLLGGRPKKPDLFRNGVADYERMAMEPSFEEGLQRVLAGTEKFKIALMCSEHNPLECHRCLLVGRALASKSGFGMRHLLSSGQIVSQTDIEDKLISRLDGRTSDLFAGDDQLSAAYRKQASKHAYVLRASAPKDSNDRTNVRAIAGHRR